MSCPKIEQTSGVLVGEVARDSFARSLSLLFCSGSCAHTNGIPTSSEGESNACPGQAQAKADVELLSISHVKQPTLTKHGPHSRTAYNAVRQWSPALSVRNYEPKQGGYSVKKIFRFLAICTISAVLTASSIAWAHTTYTQVDYPGAVLTEIVGGPNLEGTSVGVYNLTAGGANHGFARNCKWHIYGVRRSGRDEYYSQLHQSAGSHRGQLYRLGRHQPRFRIGQGNLYNRELSRCAW